MYSRRVYMAFVCKANRNIFVFVCLKLTKTQEAYRFSPPKHRGLCTNNHIFVTNYH